MKYCIIPDVHGRSFWKIVQHDIDNYDKVIFLGDYLDPYVSYDGVTQKEAYDNFLEILSFTKEHKNKVTLLLGNHDLHYFPNVSVEYGCRRDNERYSEIQKLFIDNFDMFQLSTTIDTKTYGKVLLTHAGVTLDYFNGFIKPYLKDGGAIDGIINNWKEKPYKYNSHLWVVGHLRGGTVPSGSFMWADLGEHSEEWTSDVNKEMGVDYQIFSHTYGYPSTEEIYKNNVYAMIDNKQLFIVD